MSFERSISALAAAITLAFGGSAQAQATGPSSSDSSTGPISGYMDFHFNKSEGNDGVLDFHRFVLLFNHSFSSRIRFVGELELEHAFVEGLEKAGEVELEQAYLDFLLTRGFNVRAGMLLVPIGIINERHEPPVFNGVERPFVDSVIVPSTWFEAGAGVHGEVARGLRYRAYVMAPLDATEFSADEGIRNGRQQGSQANVRNVGYAGRLNDALARVTGVSPNIARSLRGFYGEAGYRVWADGPARDLVAFTRYENFDTQFRMPEGFLPLQQFDRDAWVSGITYYPDPDIAVKADYTLVRNRSGIVKSPNSVNIGLGWWF